MSILSGQLVTKSTPPLIANVERSFTPAGAYAGFPRVYVQVEEADVAVSVATGPGVME